MKKNLLRTLLFVVMCSAHFDVIAADLMDVYHQAVDNDPDFKIAYSTFMSQSEVLPQAWAALLPQLTLAAVAGRTQQIVDTTIFTVNQTYNANVWKINASQAIFNYEAWSKVQQAKASVKASLASFNNAAQELMMRTTSTYLYVLFAKDTLRYAQAKKRANMRQLNQATQRFKVGVDAITAVYESQAAYDQSCAEVIAAQNDLINKNELLSQITNHLYDQVASLAHDEIPLIQPEPNTVDTWISTGLKQNFNLFVAKYNLEAARENIKAQSAGNWPVFSLSGNTAETHNDLGSLTTGIKSISQSAITDLASSVFIPKRQVLSNIGISMNFPIIQGGLVVSQTRQAEYNYQTSSQQLEKVYRGLVVGGKIAFNNVIAGIQKVKADRKTVFSQQASLDSVNDQYLAGTRTMTDVVLAQRNLYEAQEQLAKDQ